MAAIRLNIIQPNLREQRYSCHGCGNCCRDFTVQLREEDMRKLEKHGWAKRLGFSPVVEFRGEKYLRQRDDGSCVFWMDDGRCRIHAEFGFEEKPIACQLFPFSLTPSKGGAVTGVNFACQSVLENKGAALRAHVRDLKRMARSLPEVKPLAQPPMLTNKLRASEREVEVITSRIDVWLRRDEIDFNTRIDGLAWVVESLEAAKLQNVRDRRFADLLDALFGALPQELEFHPVGPPLRGQKRLLRQAVFARVEDPKIGRVLKAGKARTTLGQFLRSRRFARGRGAAPRIGADWPDRVPMQSVERISAATDREEIAAIDDLLTRWLRATVLGGRAWGAGYYGWPIVEGLKAMMLNVATVGWLSRLHAGGRPSGESNESIDRVSIKDVRAALGRVDRTSGRAKWLGTRTELWRLKYLYLDDGMRRLLRQYRLVD